MQLQTFLNSNSKFIKPPSVYHIHTEGGLYYPYGFIGWSHPPNPKLFFENLHKAVLLRAATI